MGASKRDTATQFGVSTRTLENVMKKVSNQLQKVRTFAAQNMKPRLDSHHGFVASIERAREIMQRDALYRDLLLTREPEGVVHIYAEAFVRAYKALQEASSRAAEMEKELKKYRTARGRVRGRKDGQRTETSSVTAGSIQFCFADRKITQF